MEETPPRLSLQRSTVNKNKKQSWYYKDFIKLILHECLSSPNIISKLNDSLQFPYVYIISLGTFPHQPFPTSNCMTYVEDRRCLSVIFLIPNSMSHLCFFFFFFALLELKNLIFGYLKNLVGLVFNVIKHPCRSTMGKVQDTRKLRHVVTVF